MIKPVDWNSKHGNHAHFLLVVYNLHSSVKQGFEIISATSLNDKGALFTILKLQDIKIVKF